MKVALAGRNKLSWLTDGPPKPPNDKKEDLTRWNTEKLMMDSVLDGGPHLQPVHAV